MTVSFPHQTTARKRSRVRSAFCLIAAAVFPVAVSANEELLASFQHEVLPVLDEFCYDCHGYGSDKGGVVLDGFEEGRSLLDRELWLRAMKNVRSHIMPPADEAQPSPEQREQLISWIKDKAFGLNPANPDPGRITVQRLNRVEYQNTIRELIGGEFDAWNEFPADDTGHGFDNNGDVLTISPLLLEKYLDSAQHIVAQAVPTQPTVVAENEITGKSFLDSEGNVGRIEDNSLDLSYYSPATFTTTYEIKHAGDYELVLNTAAVEKHVENQFDLNQCRIVFKADGEVLLDQKFIREGYKQFVFRFDRTWEAGPHELTFEIEPLTPDVEQLRDLRLRVSDVTVRDPMAREYWTTPDRYEEFYPGEVPRDPAARREYAKELLSSFAGRAFRRPVDEPTVDRLVALAEEVTEQPGGTFELGVSKAMVAILASPRFIFREEQTEPLLPGEIYPNIDEYSLASRLSYFFWSSMPDGELFELASRGELRANFDTQVQRMLDDPRSNEFVRNFTGQWLQARDIEGVAINDLAVSLRDNPNPEAEDAMELFRSLRVVKEEDRTPEQVEQLKQARDVFLAMIRAPRPELTRDLREAMRLETEMVFDHVLREDRSLLELIDSDYTFLNEELADHYGIEGISGEDMRLVQLAPDSPRGGVLTQGTVLTVTSNPTRTSPVKRGVFILDNILGTPPAPPPPNIPPLENVASKDELREMTLRETLALHAKKPLCNSCHSRMDPLGLALENFTAMGRWRDSDMNQPIDTPGELITGEKFNNIQELKRILATEHRHDFYHCLTEKLLTYALGRGLEYYDTETLDQIVARLEETGGKPSALIAGIVNSAPFQKSRVAESELAHNNTRPETLPEELAKLTP
jgi:hypothetical protein